MLAKIGGWRTWVVAGVLTCFAFPAESQAFFPPIFNPPSEPQFGPPPQPPEVMPPTPPVVPPIPPEVPPPVVPPIPPVLPPVVDPPVETPEPATVVSGLLGLAALSAFGLRRRARQR